MTRHVDCDWCAYMLAFSRQWPTHHDASGQPLFDRNHHAGRWIDQETSDRISKDGP